MGKVHEIKDAVSQLSPEDMAAFRAWFAEFDAQLWDHQIAQDAAAGRLDRLADEALSEIRTPRSRG